MITGKKKKKYNKWKCVQNKPNSMYGYVGVWLPKKLKIKNLH